MSAEREMVQRLCHVVADLVGEASCPPGEETVYSRLIQEARALLATPDTAAAIIQAARDHEMYQTACNFPPLHGAVLHHDAAQKER